MTVAFKSLPYYVNNNFNGFDALIVDESKRIFGVFDGIGTSQGARFAADKCVELIGINTHGDDSWEQLSAVLQKCMDTVSKQLMAGCTATVVSVTSDGRLQFAHAGDSRLYVLNNKRIKQITADEGMGNLLHNYIGDGARGICQAGVVYSWDKFMLCTDGITGDWEDQLVDDEQLERLLCLPQKPAVILDRIVGLSKKDDDKTIIVVER